MKCDLYLWKETERMGLNNYNFMRNIINLYRFLVNNSYVYLGLFLDCLRHSWKQSFFCQNSNIFSSSEGKLMDSGTGSTMASVQKQSANQKHKTQTNVFYFTFKAILCYSQNLIFVFNHPILVNNISFPNKLFFFHQLKSCIMLFLII